MDLATQAHLKTLRDLLGYQLGQLRADVHAAQRERVGSAGVGRAGAIEPDEETEPAPQTASGQEQRDRAEIQEVEAALHRLDAGLYGDCSDCAEPIALQRLLIQPAARRCAWCQARHEADERFSSA